MRVKHTLARAIEILKDHLGNYAFFGDNQAAIIAKSVQYSQIEAKLSLKNCIVLKDSVYQDATRVLAEVWYDMNPRIFRSRDCSGSKSCIIRAIIWKYWTVSVTCG